MLNSSKQPNNLTNDATEDSSTISVGIIIQARMGSTRLPGKVMLPLPYGSDMTVLDWVIDRCLVVPKILDDNVSDSRAKAATYRVVVATTMLDEDNAIVEACERFSEFRAGIASGSIADLSVFRGHETDLLDRYFHAAKANSFDIIVRVTSDCPFVDPYLISEGLSHMLHGMDMGIKPSLDYLSNNLDEELPHGLDFEIITFKALETAFHEADENEREHVTTYIRESGKFSIQSLHCDLSYNPRVEVIDGVNSLAKATMPESTIPETALPATKKLIAQGLNHDIGSNIERNDVITLRDLHITIDNYMDYILLLVVIDELAIDSYVDKINLKSRSKLNLGDTESGFIGSNILLESIIEVFHAKPYLRYINTQMHNDSGRVLK